MGEILERGKSLAYVLLVMGVLTCTCSIMYFGVLRYVKWRKGHLSRWRVRDYNNRRFLVFFEVIVISWIPVALVAIVLRFGNGLHHNVIRYCYYGLSAITIVYDLYLACNFFTREEYMRKRIST